MHPLCFDTLEQSGVDNRCYFYVYLRALRLCLNTVSSLLFLTGYGKVNGVTREGEEIATALNPDSIHHPTHSSHDDRCPIEHHLKPRPSPKSAALHGAVERRGGEGGNSAGDSKSNMDCPNDRPPDLKTLEGKKEALVSLNGIVASSASSSPLSNGYPGKPGTLTDNDGSGSENGYTTPKKRRNGQRSAKPASGDIVIVAQTAKAMHSMPVGKQQPEPPLSAESADKHSSSVVHGNGRIREVPVASSATALPPGEFPRKNSEGKAASKKFEERPVKAKAVTAAASAAAKDDSWTLFKPPPVFPVDNSSAKIVPKISYASKVKENLNRASAQACSAAERDPLLLPPATPQVPGKLSQVPMSAVKTITSASFTNGPLPSAESGNGNNGCPLPGAPFNAPAASGTASVLVSQGGENVASPQSSSATPGMGGAPVVAEPRKPSLFVYPHAAGPPSNMQLSLPSGRQADPPPPSSASSSSVPSGSASNPSSTAPAHQKSLGEIFQNQWGLSFINEPSAGPDGGGSAGGGADMAAAASAGSRTEGRARPTVVTFQGGFPSGPLPLQGHSSTTSPQRQEQPPFPKAYELDKRTNPLSSSRVVTLRSSPGPLAQEGGLLQTPSLPSGAPKDEPRNHSAIVFSSSSAKDLGVDLIQAPPTNTAPVLALAREQGHTKGFERRSSWGMFDLKAAVIYHTKGNCFFKGF